MSTFPEMTVSCIVSDLPYGLEIANWDLKHWAEKEFFVNFFEQHLNAVIQSNNCASWTWIFFCGVAQVPLISSCLVKRGITFDNFYWVKTERLNQSGPCYTSAVVICHNLMNINFLGKFNHCLLS